MTSGSGKTGKSGGKCPGCASKPSNACPIAKCAKAHRVETCGQCSQYPCADIKAFHKGKAPYRAMAAHNLDVIKEKGLPAWLEEQDKRWRCEKCAGEVAWNAKACGRCNATLKTVDDDVKALGLAACRVYSPPGC